MTNYLLAFGIAFNIIFLVLGGIWEAPVEQQNNFLLWIILFLLLLKL